MSKFKVIPQNAFEGLQLDAGVLAWDFDPTDPQPIPDENLICATTGGITVTAQPTYSDLAADVDNAPDNLLEFNHLDGWNCSMSTTSLGTSVETIRLALGAADVDGEKISIRRAVQKADYKDIWWVGDRADGGLVAAKLYNALSTAGLSLKTGKNAKGQITLTLTGYVSIEDQDQMPLEFWSCDPEEDETATQYEYTAVEPVGTENPSEEGWYVLIGDSYRITQDTEVDANVTYFERAEVSNP